MFYNEGKGRSHFGFISKFRGKKRRYPDVLHVRHLSIAAAHLTMPEQAAAKVAFDVIRVLGGTEILSLPMADAPWAGSIIPSDLQEQIGSVATITAKSPPLFEVAASPRQRASSVRIDVDPDGRHIARQYRPAYHFQRLVRQHGSDNSELFDYVDRETLMRVVEQDPST